MLVLSRKENETVEFPGLGVVIRVFGLTRRRVQLGIDAPISLKITRGERRGEPTTASVESIAEYVIGAEFDRLESELQTLADLADARDCSTARQVATDAIDRVGRIKRTVAASLDRQPNACVRQVEADYVTQRPDPWPGGPQYPAHELASTSI